MCSRSYSMGARSVKALPRLSDYDSSALIRDIWRAIDHIYIGPEILYVLHVPHLKSWTSKRNAQYCYWKQERKKKSNPIHGSKMRQRIETKYAKTCLYASQLKGRDFVKKFRNNSLPLGLRLSVVAIAEKLSFNLIIWLSRATNFHVFIFLLSFFVTVVNLRSVSNVINSSYLVDSILILIFTVFM